MIVNYLFEASKFFCSLQKSLLRQRSFVVTGPGDQLQHRSTPWCPNQISLLKTSKNFLLIIFLKSQSSLQWIEVGFKELELETKKYFVVVVNIL